MEPRDKLCSFYSHDLDKVSLADLVTFTEEILNGKLHFLCSEIRVFVTPVASSSLRHFKKFLSVLEIF